VTVGHQPPTHTSDYLPATCTQTPETIPMQHPNLFKHSQVAQTN